MIYSTNDLHNEQQLVIYATSHTFLTLYFFVRRTELLKQCLLKQELKFYYLQEFLVQFQLILKEQIYKSEAAPFLLQRMTVL